MNDGQCWPLIIVVLIAIAAAWAVAKIEDGT